MKVVILGAIRSPSYCVVEFRLPNGSTGRAKLPTDHLLTEEELAEEIKKATENMKLVLSRTRILDVLQDKELEIDTEL